MTAPDFPALVAQARARLDEIERVAKAASTLDGKGEAWFGPLRLSQVLTYPWGGPTDEYPQVMAEADAAHIAAWSPDVALRVVEWGRGVLERHGDDDPLDGDLRHICPQCLMDWPCDDVRAVFAFLLPGSVTE